MKRLVLVRHATAVPGDEETDDFSRRLRRRGRREARDMAAWYATLGLGADLLWSSPADRALHTAKIFARGLGIKKRDVQADERLYENMAPSEFLALVHGLDDGLDTVLVFGHNPTFADFAGALLAESAPFAGDLPKCGVVVAQCPRRKWSAMRLGEARLEAFEHPRSRRAVVDNLASGIEQGIMWVLDDHGVAPTDALLRDVTEAAANIARRHGSRAIRPEPEAESEAAQ